MGKKHHEEDHIDETWLIPYSDMLVLLLALFIVMFAMSKVDQEKFKKMATSMRGVFSGSTAVIGTGGGSGNTVIELPNLTPLPTSSTTPTPGSSSGGMTGGQIEDARMKEIRDALEGQIEDRNYQDKMKVELNAQGLEIVIQDVALFQSGDAAVVKDAYPMLSDMSAMLQGIDNNIIIAGHTDNVPVRVGTYKSNWDLSAMRAINVMHYLVDNGKIAANHFSVRAFGEFSPRYDNSTAEGRAKNRRVEIFIERIYPDGTAAEATEPTEPASPSASASSAHSE